MVTVKDRIGDSRVLGARDIVSLIFSTIILSKPETLLPNIFNVSYPLFSNSCLSDRNSLGIVF